MRTVDALERFRAFRVVALRKMYGQRRICAPGLRSAMRRGHLLDRWQTSAMSRWARRARRAGNGTRSVRFWHTSCSAGKRAVLSSIARWFETVMRVICAWCQHEGRPGLLRVQEPLEDTSETHGICDRHQQAVFEGFPSRSFPETRWLFIVPASDTARYEHLAGLLRGVAGATVIIDRRVGERRRRTESIDKNRRRYERRIRRPQPSSLGYALVRFAIRNLGTDALTGSSAGTGRTRAAD